jgi:hypothetical protein
MGAGPVIVGDGLELTVTWKTVAFVAVHPDELK